MKFTHRSKWFLTFILGLAAPRSGAAACTAATLQGEYGFSMQGSNVGLGSTYATLGRFVSDGKGHISGTSVQTVNGNFSRSAFTASYEVTDDCTGTADMLFDGWRASLNFTIVLNGNEVLMLVKDNGTVETGSAKKQFVEPLARSSHLLH